MSTALRKAIFGRLTGTETLTGDALTAQQAFIALLASDPDLSIVEPPRKVPCVFISSMSDVKSAGGEVLYPCVTFRETGGTPDNRFQQQTGAVGTVLIDFEIWDNTQSGTLISDIEDAMLRLLDMRRGIAPPMSLESGKLYQSQIFTPLQIVYDKNYHSQVGLVRYQFLEVRY
jgi:hypothetical protein